MSKAKYRIRNRKDYNKSQGFLSSLVMFMGLCLYTPGYSQICRRAQLLGKDLKRLTKRKITDLVIDSTGLKVYGEGEWKVRQHGYSKRRTWRKLHLAICPDSHEILFVKLTDNKTPDHKIYPQFLETTPKTVKRTYADGAYDRESCYRAIISNYSSAKQCSISNQCTGTSTSEE